MMSNVTNLAGQLPCRLEQFQVQGQPAFVFAPQKEASSRPAPWLWYAPTLENQTPAAPCHTWMFTQFLDAGIAIAGVNVGESCGSPRGRETYSALRQEMVDRRRFAPRAILMPQSRGGLMLYNWAAEHADQVLCIAGIYTVCDVQSYPGINQSVLSAFEMTHEEFVAHLAENNPIDRLAPLAKARVPIFHIHGDQDTVVPLERNSGELANRYKALGGDMRLLIVPGKGHAEVPEFFHNQDIVDFVIAQAALITANPKYETRNSK